MLTLILLILMVAGILAIRQFFHIKYNSKALSKLPSPPTLPLIGNGLYGYDTFEGLWNSYRKFVHDYYPIVCIWIFFKPIVLIRHPDDIQAILKNKKNSLEKSDFFYTFFRIKGIDGILTSEVKKWHVRRKLLNAGVNRIRATNEILDRQTKSFIQQIKNKGDKSVHNVLPAFMKYGMDVMCDSILGRDELDENEEYIRAKYRKDVEKFLKIIFYRIAKPYLTDWVIKFLPLGWKQSKSLNTLKDFSSKVVERREKYLKINGIKLSDDSFSNTENSKTPKGESTTNLIFLDELIRNREIGLLDQIGIQEEIANLTVAGFESTSMALSLVLLTLAENEKEQNLARKEVVDFMKENDNKLKIADLPKLQYLDRCVKESLRLHPVIPMIGRKLGEDTVLGKYNVPRNTDVVLNIFDLHRDPNIWTEPNKFNPDRFLPEFVKDRHPFAYIPFAKGPRICIGAKFAVDEIKFVLAHILYNFVLKPVDFTKDLKFAMYITLKPSVKQLRVNFIKIR